MSVAAGSRLRKHVAPACSCGHLAEVCPPGFPRRASAAVPVFERHAWLESGLYDVVAEGNVFAWVDLPAFVTASGAERADAEHNLTVIADDTIGPVRSAHHP